MQSLLRQPFALLGAVGLVSMLKSVITLHEDVVFVVEAYQTVTRPIWDYLLGWLGLDLSPFMKDYLTVSAIFAGAVSRIFVTDQKDESTDGLIWSHIIGFIGGMIFWPFFFLLYTGHLLLPAEEGDTDVKYANMFFSSLLWSAIILATSYGLFFYDPGAS